jgi:hypothetical protein|tara:strand:- start:1255 stop:1500 length:246 start_codon:yes stop_codon:yes gene_type:complete
MSHPYTVIAFVEESGVVVAHQVTAENGLSAFAEAALIDPDLTMVVALEGWKEEGVGLTLPGDGLVDAETVLDQPDVFPITQ